MENYWRTPASHRITDGDRVGEIDVSLWNFLVKIRTRALEVSSFRRNAPRERATEVPFENIAKQIPRGHSAIDRRLDRTRLANY